jgi:zinc/manganese transport system substrate-binding protein
MRRRTLLGCLPLLAAPLPFRPAAAATALPLPVVATFSVLADLTARVGGNAIAIASLVPPDGDPHEYEPTTADLRRLAVARVLVENGLGLEGWLTRLADAADFKGQRIIASAAVTPRRLGAGLDPHAWQDPHNGVLYVRAIAAGLAKAAPESALAFATRAAALIQEIEETDRWIARTLAAIPPARRRVVTSHDAFGYYAARYGIQMVGVQGLSTEDEPSAREMADLVALIKRDHIRAVLMENMTSPRLAETLAHETGAVLGGKVYADALSPPGAPADSYVAMLRTNTAEFARVMTAN